MSNKQYSEVTKLTLKNQALLQRISELTSDYEDKYQSLRVEYTLVVSERDELAQELENARKELESVQEADTYADVTADVPERDSDSD